MAQQLHHGPYEMVVIVNIASMKFLPFMNMAMWRPAARMTVRSLVRNHAGKRACAGMRHRAGWRRSISDFGGYRALPERP
jgi:hypothetical protein